jgi:hypothetical protein
MTMSIRCRKASPVVALLLACMLPLAVSGAERSKAKVLKPGEFNPTDDSVDMFAAMKDGKIKVKLIAKDSTEANVFIENVSKKPLNVQLPEAFAAVPVLAQFGGMGGGAAGGRGGMAGGGMAQGMGGGMGGMGGGGMGGMGGGMGGGGMGGGGGFFNVAPEKKASFKVPVVCLEHGKPDPRPAIAYEIRPLDTFTSKPGVLELCMLLGYGKLDQRGAQVAAWNLNSNMSWDQLANKQIERLNGDSYPYFNQDEMRTGMAAVATSMSMAEQRAKNPAPVKTPGTDSPVNTKDALSVPAATKKE